MPERKEGSTATQIIGTPRPPEHSSENLDSRLRETGVFAMHSDIQPVRSPVSAESVLVDVRTEKVDTVQGFVEVTTTREERHASQLDAAARRVAERKTLFQRERHVPTMTSSKDGLPKLDGQAYATVRLDGYAPSANPLSYLVVNRGPSTVRYISGRMNSSQVRRRGR